MTGHASTSHAAEIPVRGRDLGRDVIDAIMREADRAYKNGDETLHGALVDIAAMFQRFRNG